MDMKRIFYAFICCLPVLAALLGCTADEYRQLEYGRDAGHILLSIDTRGKMFGADAGSERKIDELSLLFYQQDGELVWTVGKDDYTIDNGCCVISVPEHNRKIFNGKEFTVCVLANCPEIIEKKNLERVKSLEKLYSYVVRNSLSNRPKSFVMFGEVRKNINLDKLEGRQLGTVALARLASKVVVNYPGFAHKGYLLRRAWVKIKNAANESPVQVNGRESSFDGAKYTSDFKELGMDRSSRFYTYPWNGDKEPILIYKLELKRQSDGEVMDCYYQLRLRPKTIANNYCYTIDAKMVSLGARTEGEAVGMSGQFVAEPWKLVEAEYEFSGHEYLVVAEEEVIMNDISDYSIAYKSSNPNLIIEELQAEFRYTGADGRYVREEISRYSQDGYISQFPEVWIDKTNGKICIYSPIPENNVPKYIEFDVTHPDHRVRAHVRIEQRPPIYITNTVGTESIWRYQLPEYLNNKAIYHIRILSPRPDMVLGFPKMESKRFYQVETDYPYPESWARMDYAVTSDDPVTANMVSPSFELASQLGATLPSNYAWYYSTYDRVLHGYPDRTGLNYKQGMLLFDYIQTWKHHTFLFDGYWRDYLTDDYGQQYSYPPYALIVCAQYWEKRIVNGREEKIEGWRLPTDAEIRLIDELQNNERSAVKDIMTADYYWSNYSRGWAHPMSNGNGHGTATEGYIRCVRDVKEDNK